MKRNSILLVLFMALAAACGGNEASPSATDADADPTATVVASESSEPSAEATDDPAASGDTGFDGDLADLIPEELNGVARTEIPGMEQMLTQVFASQGLNASQAEFVFTSYGEGDDFVMLQAIRVPGVEPESLESIARALAGAGSSGELDPEEITIDGSNVLRMSAGTQGAAYLYFAEGAAFVVVSQNDDLAEQLISELP